MANFNQVSTISISCPKRLADILEKEVIGQGFKPLSKRITGVDVEGSLNDCIRLNLFLRTAHRIHFLLAEKSIDTPEALYAWLSSVEWENYIDSRGYMSVTSRIDHPSIDNTQFANLKVKDAIVDRIRAKKGSRPDSGNDLNKTVVFLYWDQNIARVFLDTSGESLSRRGYRVENAKAPMQESLAAAILLSSRWKPGTHLINPMCGSGTIAIEAALMATGAEAAPNRRNFGFMHILGFDRDVYKQLRVDARKNRPKTLDFKIIATDNDPRAIEAAKKNTEVSGMADYIEFHNCDFSRTPIPDGDGVLVFNPPYGERIGEVKDLEPLYSDIGTFLKHECPGKTGYIFTGNLELAKKIGLKPSSKTPFYNTTIDCRLFEFELFQGKAKHQ